VRGVDVDPVEIIVGELFEDETIVSDVHQDPGRLDFRLEVEKDGNECINGVSVAVSPVPGCLEEILGVY
jgi:hypothetical protein